ncbi:hypothetical protein DSM106972_034250 [Dulcicalothrix desertica PCC 7102]|uniref:PEP-CTERM protein-sorting domain-containing protein n=1 Tax=Dulcicalothrix desertica PCC 7102 TaxID=232991 RepID=A0A3S1CFF4_9CYAN|nr:PEP-CTERM sorting domain-containing protein [Dulcicalothrix desertica]RUT06219.1 hypothetical protein DSM106972_034250 [Dulcicalothrix desertica PCC 7102]TWH54120.1 putative secreted protein with PEP-CTERM sorting signal [Dulcicalothrix desertica PCC 7102]
MTRLTIPHKFFPVCIGVLFAALGLLQTGRASATQSIFDQKKVLFDNDGVPSLTAGREATLWIQAEDFAVEQDSWLDHIQFWTVEAPGSKWDGTVKYSLFEDIDGQPDTQPFVSGIGANVVKKATNRSLFNYYDEYSYSFDLEKPVKIAADTTYWLGLHLSSNFDRDEIYWETTDKGFGTNGMSAYLGELKNWSRSSAPVERAFVLNSKSSTNTREVPEPSAILGTLLVVGAVLRSKKN